MKVPVQVYLEPDQIEKLDELATERDKNRAELIRKYISRGLEGDTYA